MKKITQKHAMLLLLALFLMPLGANAASTISFESLPAFDLLQGDLNIGAPLAQAHPGYTLKGGGNTLYLPIPYK